MMDLNFRTRSLPLAAAWFAISFAVPLLSSSSARADVACGETTCPKGFECKEESGGCPAIACLDAPCEPCVPPVRSVCHPTPCSVDADCASDMACAEFTQTECSGGGASCRDGDCPEASPEPTCVTKTLKQCAPRWSLPCASAADCGPGFTCEPEIARGCSGSGPVVTPGSDTGAPVPPTGTGGASSSGTAERAPSKETGGAASNPPECTSEPTGRNLCVVVQTACTSDTDCLSGFSCRDNPEGSCTADSSGNTSCTPADPPKLCVPPYYDLDSGGARGVATDEASSPGSAVGAALDKSGVSASGGGCTFSGRETHGALAGVLGLLGLSLGLGLRRRRATAR